MKNSFKVACIQNCATEDLVASVADACELIRAARAADADLVCTPEFFSCLSMTSDGLFVGRYTEETHPALPVCRDLAAELGIWLLLGSLAVRGDTGKLRNRSYVIDATGQVVARYDKIHLFDVDLGPGESYRESDVLEPGEHAVNAPTPWGLLGLSVCYDLRFAYLYRALARAGALFLTVPAAFTRTTGKAHWHALLRTRAIETGSYVFAPCQYGAHGKAQTYGHSLVIDPWGEVLCDAGEDRGFVVADVYTHRVEQARKKIPALQHDRVFSGPAPMTLKQARG